MAIKAILVHTYSTCVLRHHAQFTQQQLHIYAVCNDVMAAKMETTH